MAAKPSMDLRMSVLPHARYTRSTGTLLSTAISQPGECRRGVLGQTLGEHGSRPGPPTS